MSDQSQEQSYTAPASAPDAEATAASDVADTGTQGGEEQSQEPKLHTQEEVNALIAKEKAKVERKLRRELTQGENQAPVTGDPPDPKQFKDALEFSDALADWKVAERDARVQQTTVDTSFGERLDTFVDAHSDFDQVVRTDPNEGGPAISAYMMEVIKESDIGPEVAYYLGKNVAESHRIFALSPLQQAKELGRIEASLSSGNTPPARRTSSAPDPIKPVAGNRGTTLKVDVSDPRSDKSMSDTDWINQRNKTASR